MKWLLLASLIFPFHASWAVDNGCLRTISERISEHSYYLHRRYKNISITGPGVRAGNEPQILLGYRDEGVILFHGFMASPFEVLELGEYLNSKGYTVYMPLIFGFGSDANVAGEATLEDWKLSVTAAVRMMRACFQKINLMGFSLGGGLSASYVLKEKPTDIASLTLLSPYFKPHAWYSKMVNSVVTAFTDSIKLTRLFNLSCQPKPPCHPDLEIPLAFHDYYNEFMSMSAVKTIHEFRDELKDIPSHEASPIHTAIAYSEADNTVDTKFAMQYTLEHFSKVRGWIAPKRKGIPHQITVTFKKTVKKTNPETNEESEEEVVVNDPTKLFEFVEKFLKH
jgi:esterase/lipase